jgi:hypothetical protein
MKIVLEENKYDVPILSEEHAAFCHAEAARRYAGRIIRDGEMLLVEHANGLCHTDKVLRALSFFKDSSADINTALFQQLVSICQHAAESCDSSYNSVEVIATIISVLFYMDQEWGDCDADKVVQQVEAFAAA